MKAPLGSILVLSFFAIAGAACASGGGNAPPLHPDACHETLAERCAHGGCETFDVAAARVRKPQPGALARYEIGTCGSYRFVHEQTMGDGTSYFDADGKLVASTQIADAPVCEGSYGSTVGKIESCKQVVTESHDWSADAVVP